MNDQEKNAFPEDEALIGYMNSIAAPESLRKDIIMKKDFKKRHKRNFKSAALAFGLCVAGLFALTDGIVYAATNESLISKIFITIDGQFFDYTNLTKTTDENGNDCYSGSVKTEDGSEMQVTVHPDAIEDENVSLEMDVE